MKRSLYVRAIGVAMTVAMFMPAGAASAQTTSTSSQTVRQAGRQGQQSPPPAGREQQTPPGGRANRPGPGGRGLPPITPNMNQQQLQTWIDTYALVQANQDLQLTADQYPTFVAKLTTVQNIKRRHQMEKRRILGELNRLVQGSGESGRDEAILAQVKAMDDLSQRAGAELQKAYQDLDSTLTPWQRGRYRMFEEMLERRKVDLLSKINGTPSPSPAPGGGRGGK